MILRLKSAMQVLRDQSGGGGLRPELRPVTGGGVSKSGLKEVM